MCYRHAHLTHDNAVASYFHVVRKMDKVVDLGAVANDSGSQGATIDGGI